MVVMEIEFRPTSDVCDDHDDANVVTLAFHSLGGRDTMAGVPIFQISLKLK